MATESIDIIQHLLEVENEAAQMQLDAQKQADEKIARVRSESDARYKSECAENARVLESEEKAKIQQINDNHSQQIESFKASLESTPKSPEAFKSTIEEMLFA